MSSGDIEAIDRANREMLQEMLQEYQRLPAATSVGDPFTADHLSVSVPGVSSTTRAAIAGMTNEAAALRQEAATVASRAGESTNIATVAWAGYQPPPSLTSAEVLTDDLAQAGAPKLTSFLQNLDTASQNPGQTTALFGHSYGSLTSGIALHDDVAGNGYEFNIGQITVATLNITGDCFLLQRVLDLPAGQLPPEPPIVPSPTP